MSSNKPTTTVQSPPKAHVKPKTKKSGKPKATPAQLLKKDLLAPNADTREAPLYHDFKSSSGAQTTSVKEIVYACDDYLDLTGVAGYNVLRYDPTNMPGATGATAFRWLNSAVFVLEPVIAGSNASNNTLVLSGVRTVGLDSAVSLACGQQTMILPSNAPKWRKVFAADLGGLADQGISISSLNTAVSEVARIAFLNPDSGAVNPAITLQAKVSLTYAVSIDIQSTASLSLATAQNATSVPPAPVFATTAVFPRALRLQNRM